MSPGDRWCSAPDATALGQVDWDTVEGEGSDLEELRSIQDWYLCYQINAVEGVSEVASIGGFVKHYQIDVPPDELRTHRVSLFDVYEAVRMSNIDVGAQVPLAQVLTITSVLGPQEIKGERGRTAREPRVTVPVTGSACFVLQPADLQRDRKECAVYSLGCRAE